MKRALVSVADKKELAKVGELLAGKYEIISTGSTASELLNLGYEVTKVSDVIEFEEILGGRVKTLHPKIHGGILTRRTEEDNQELANHNIIDIDVVICNLYPFEAVTANQDVNFSDAIENIDIGGVTLLRAAAKNHQHVTIICDPTDYNLLADEITFETRKYLAAKAFEHTAYYDVLIANYLKKQVEYENSDLLLVGARKANSLRYGENAHQKAEYYLTVDNQDYSLQNAEQLHGKELSYNNIKDIDAALNLISEFTSPTAVALKHNTPCGIGQDNDIDAAFIKCQKMDPVSIFGGIVAVNETIDADLAQMLNDIFLEVIIAPSFSDKALNILKQKANVRLLEVEMNNRTPQKEVISINGGYLVQEKDQNKIEHEVAEVVTSIVPSEERVKQAKIAQTVCKYVKSNAIVIATSDEIVSQGGGQTSRIDAAKIALEKAKNAGYNKNLILASDAFFPFSDVVELAKEYGVQTIIQPGGSIRDEEVIAKANELGLEMIITGVRHFKH